MTLEPQQLLYITGLPEDKIKAVKGVRRALELLGVEDVTMEDCQDIVDFVRRDGFTFIGSTADDEFARKFVSELALLGTAAEINKDVSFESSDDDDDELDEFKRVAVTSLTMMGWHAGDPIPACAQSAMLARTTGDREFYERVLSLLIETFPWIENNLREQGVIE